MVFFLGSLENFYIMTTLLKHATKIASSDACTRYCKTHPHSMRVSLLIILVRDYLHTCLLSCIEHTCHQANILADADPLWQPCILDILASSYKYCKQGTCAEDASLCLTSLVRLFRLFPYKVKGSMLLFDGRTDLLDCVVH